MLAQDCAGCYDKTDQHERHWHSDEHGQRAVGVLQEIQVYFTHSFPVTRPSVLTHCNNNIWMNEQILVKMIRLLHLLASPCLTERVRIRSASFELRTFALRTSLLRVHSGGLRFLKSMKLHAKIALLNGVDSRR